MNQRKMFDDEIQELTSSHSRAIEKLKKFHGEEKQRLEQQLASLKEGGAGKDSLRVSHCWSSCSSVPNTPSPFPVARSSSQSTNLSSISTASSARTVLVAPNKMELEGEEFDIAEDLERSMEMFTGMLRAKEEEVEVLETRLLELQREMEEQ